MHPQIDLFFDAMICHMSIRLGRLRSYPSIGL
jgi:hypothetical protein